MRGLLKFLSIMAILAAMYYARQYLSYHKVEQESLFFVTDTVNTIGQNWDEAAFDKVADATLKSGGSIPSSFASFRKIGPMVKPATCELNDFTAYKYQGTTANYISATYQCQAVFEKGPATITLTIVRFQDTQVWKVLSFDVFAKPSAAK